MYLKNIIIGIILFIHSDGFSQNFYKTELNNNVSILKGRFFLNFFSDKQINIQSIDRTAISEEIEAITLDIEGKKVVLFITNLFSIGDDHLFSEINKSQKNILKYEKKVLVDKNSIYAVLSSPIHKDYGDLVNRLIIKNQDNTISQIQACISQDAYKQKEKYMEFTEKIFKTISKGNRVTNLNERTENLFLQCDEKKYQIDFPKNYNYIEDEFYDSKLTKIIKYNKYNDDTDNDNSNFNSKIIFFYGSQPRNFFKQFKNRGEVSKGFFLNQKIEWNTASDERKELFLKEQTIKTTENQKDMVLQIAMISNSQEDLNELTKIVESIKYIE